MNKMIIICFIFAACLFNSCSNKDYKIKGEPEELVLSSLQDLTIVYRHFHFAHTNGLKNRNFKTYFNVSKDSVADTFIFLITYKTIGASWYNGTKTSGSFEIRQHKQYNNSGKITLINFINNQTKYNGVIEYKQTSLNHFNINFNQLSVSKNNAMRILNGNLNTYEQWTTNKGELSGNMNSTGNISYIISIGNSPIKAGNDYLDVYPFNKNNEFYFNDGKYNLTSNQYKSTVWITDDGGAVIPSTRFNTTDESLNRMFGFTPEF